MTYAEEKLAELRASLDAGDHKGFSAPQTTREREERKAHIRIANEKANAWQKRKKP